MKRYICNNCRTEGEPQRGYDAAPAGWFTLSRIGGTDEQHKPLPKRYEYETDTHLCSPACIIEHTKKRIMTETDLFMEQENAAALARNPPTPQPEAYDLGEIAKTPDARD